MSCREGRADPEIRSAKRTTLCKALQSWLELFPYHTRACERSGAWSERGAERSVRNIVGARSGFLAKGRSDRSVSLRFRSNTAHTTSLGHAQIHPEAERSGVTLSGGAGGANTHVSGERKFSPLSSAHMLCEMH